MNQSTRTDGRTDGRLMVVVGVDVGQNATTTVMEGSSRLNAYCASRATHARGLSSRSKIYYYFPLFFSAMRASERECLYVCVCASRRLYEISVHITRQLAVPYLSICVYT